MAQYYQVRHHESRHILSGMLGGIVGAIGGAIILVLASRLVLTFMEVDRLRPYINVIYDLSYPFVAPFFTLFNYQSQMGVSRFEVQTLAALVFWTIATWVIIWLIRPVKEDE